MSGVYQEMIEMLLQNRTILKIQKIFKSPYIIYIAWGGFLSYLPLSFIQYKFLYLEKSPQGSLIKRIFFTTPYVFFFVFVGVILYWLFAKKYKLSKKQLNSLYFVIVSSIAFFVVGKYLLYLESANYANYLYSSLGIEAGKLGLITEACWTVTAILFAIVFFERTFKKTLPLGEKLAIAALGIFLLSSFSLLANIALYQKMSSSPPLEKYGAQFIYVEALKRSPENAVVVHPPRGSNWPR